MKHSNILVFFTLSLFIFSCSKDSDRDKDISTNSSIDYAFGQGMVYDAFKIIHQAANSTEGISTVNLVDTTSLFGCDTLIIDTLSSPMTITVQFNGACNERTGSISATFSNKYDVLGNITNISFNNYSYRGYTLGTGTISYTYTGLTGTLPNYSYAINDVKIINSSNKMMSFSGNQTLNVSTGETTAIISDDSYIIKGAASGSTFAGNNFTASITSDLTLAGNCEWVSSGIVTVNPENKTPRTLDFGSGCDNKASITINSVAQEIELP